MGPVRVRLNGGAQYGEGKLPLPNRLLSDASSSNEVNIRRRLKPIILYELLVELDWRERLELVIVLCK